MFKEPNNLREYLPFRSDHIPGILKTVMVPTPLIEINQNVAVQGIAVVHLPDHVQALTMEQVIYPYVANQVMVAPMVYHKSSGVASIDPAWWKLF
mgnify:CR=1 FL=1